MDMNAAGEGEGKAAGKDDETHRYLSFQKVRDETPPPIKRFPREDATPRARPRAGRIKSGREPGIAAIANTASCNRICQSKVSCGVIEWRTRGLPTVLPQ